MAIFSISKSETGQKLLTLQSPVDLSHIDTYESLDEDIQFKIENGLGLWTSKDDSELWEDVKNYIQPYTLKSVEYEKNRPHSLTAFK